MFLLDMVYDSWDIMKLVIQIKFLYITYDCLDLFKLMTQVNYNQNNKHGMSHYIAKSIEISNHDGHGKQYWMQTGNSHLPSWHIC